MSTPLAPAFQKVWETTMYAFQWPEHRSEAPALIQYMYELREQRMANIASGIAPGAKSSYGLFETDFELFKRDHPALNKLRAFVIRCVQQAVSHVNGAEIEPQKLSVELLDSWAHITNSGGFHDAHFHGGCSWCGIYYLQIGESGRRTDKGAPNGGNRFYSPLWNGGNFKDYGNKYLDSVYVNPPITDGMLLLFPSYVMHSALPYQGEKDRIVISFNSSTVPA